MQNNNMHDVNQQKMILDMQKYNGRVNIISQPDPDVIFKMQERIFLKNKSTSYVSVYIKPASSDDDIGGGVRKQS